MLGCRPLTDNEVERIIDQLSSHRDKCLFILGIRTGLRISELLKLTVRDVAGVERLVVPKRLTKGKVATRSIVLHEQARMALIAYLKASEHLTPTDPLFPSLKRLNGLLAPISIVQAYRILKHAMNSVGALGATGTHSMRKTFANRVYNKLEKDLLKTKMALGHKSIDSTISYLSFDCGDVDAAILA